ncbi:MAG: hypothetical protein CM1200mP10_03530 [Candidatus Neomarinimicrobiota bacterium]|nr:MAG: hypothetical protein CM1200mP10_03530 [Candidatus Neomarinimicrobiota bacterium]
MIVGVDYDVINHPNFDLIVKYGWGGGTMPSTGEDIYGFGDFLDRGGRLLYSDMDYFWKTDLAADGIFSEGDFAYDYLGLSYTGMILTMMVTELMVAVEILIILA